MSIITLIPLVFSLFEEFYKKQRHKGLKSKTKSQLNDYTKANTLLRVGVILASVGVLAISVNPSLYFFILPLLALSIFGFAFFGNYILKNKPELRPSGLTMLYSSMLLSTLSALVLFSLGTSLCVIRQPGDACTIENMLALTRRDTLAAALCAFAYYVGAKTLNNKSLSYAFSLSLFAGTFDLSRLLRNHLGIPALTPLLFALPLIAAFFLQAKDHGVFNGPIKLLNKYGLLAEALLIIGVHTSLKTGVAAMELSSLAVIFGLALLSYVLKRDELSLLQMLALTPAFIPSVLRVFEQSLCSDGDQFYVFLRLACWTVGFTVLGVVNILQRQRADSRPKKTAMVFYLTMIALAFGYSLSSLNHGHFASFAGLLSLCLTAIFTTKAITSHKIAWLYASLASLFIFTFCPLLVLTPFGIQTGLHWLNFKLFHIISYSLINIACLAAAGILAKLGKLTKSHQLFFFLGCLFSSILLGGHLDSVLPHSTVGLLPIGISLFIYALAIRNKGIYRELGIYALFFSLGAVTLESTRKGLTSYLNRPMSDTDSPIRYIQAPEVFDHTNYVTAVACCLAAHVWAAGLVVNSLLKEQLVAKFKHVELEQKIHRLEAANLLISIVSLISEIWLNARPYNVELFSNVIIIEQAVLFLFGRQLHNKLMQGENIITLAIMLIVGFVRHSLSPISLLIAAAICIVAAVLDIHKNNNNAD